MPFSTCIKPSITIFSPSNIILNPANTVLPQLSQNVFISPKTISIIVNIIFIDVFTIVNNLSNTIDKKSNIFCHVLNIVFDELSCESAISSLLSPNIVLMSCEIKVNIPPR